MAFTNYAHYRSVKPTTTIPYLKVNVSASTGRMYSRWLASPLGAATPTTAVAPNYATQGAYVGCIAGTLLWIKRACGCKAPGGTVLWYDRLSHTGGLNATLTTTQTTNLPTAALTRYTSGVGVMMGLEVYTSIGTTLVTATVSYTNSAGTAGRTSPLATFGGANDRLSQYFMPLPLQVGDVGVKSVESVTLSASTGTAGAFGVVLWKPLFAIPLSNVARHQVYDNVRDLGAVFESVQPDACIAAMYSSLTTSTWHAAGEMQLVRQV